MAAGYRGFLGAPGPGDVLDPRPGSLSPRPADRRRRTSDLLLPRSVEATTKPLETVLGRRQRHGSAGAGELAKETGLAWPALTEALQLGCQQGKIMYDLAGDVYRFRPLTDAPLDPVRLEFRDRNERVAHETWRPGTPSRSSPRTASPRHRAWS